MKYIFFGTPDFAATILDKLIQANMKPDLVVTNPDKPAGRKQTMTAPPVKNTAARLGIPLIQPEDLDASLFDAEYDFFVVAAYGKLISKEVLDVSRLGSVNVHPSLLPKHRGPTPIQSAILDGGDKTGVSLMLMDEKMDHGPILKISNFQFLISNETYTSLSDKLAELGADMLIETLPKFMEGKITPKEQKHKNATLTKKFSSADAEIPCNDLRAALDGDKEKAEQIDRMIRALNPEPGTWTQTDDSSLLNLPKNKRVKILKSEVRDGKLVLKKIQVEGKQIREV
ncbi:methionyl-tRNA formyltransferase [bacterium]|nr:methionyl-tRNA formyltransferase [bacterium]|tara:strand:- start:5956 stop:6810 length:855 start_codon:yes stop_codon:yes gene_type:complete